MEAADTGHVPREAAPLELPESLRGRVQNARLVADRDGVALWDVSLADEPGAQVLKIVRLHAAEPIPDELVRLRAEHEALRDLDDPAVIAYREIVLDGDRLLLIRERVDGEPLSSRGGSLPLATAFQVMARVASVLSVAHSAGRLHRSLRPGNVLIQPPAADGEPVVRLVDWGLARLLPRRDGGREGLSAEVFAYLAPELSGLLQRPVDGRADLWSLGVLLYELLASRRPFDGARSETLLRATLTREPASLRALRNDVPALLDGIVSKLLAKEPSERYQHARAVSFDLAELARRIESGRGDSTFALGTEDSRGGLRVVAPLVGRDPLIVRLARTLERAASGNGALALLSGPAGVGKSRLASEIADRAVRMGGRALWGRASSTTRLVPLAPLTDAFGALVDRGASPAGGEDREVLRGRLHKGIGDLAGEVLRLVPDLAEILPSGPALPSLPPERAMFRFREALCRLLAAIGTEGRPLVLVLEDLEHADVATLKLLAHLDGGELRNAPVFVIGTYTDRGDGARPRVRDLTAGTRYELGPLERESAVALAAAVLGGGDGAEQKRLAERLVDAAGHSPARILEAARAWIDKPPAPGEPRRAAPATVGARVTPRGPAPFQVTAALAVAGTALDVEALTAVTGLDAEQVLTAADDACDRDLVMRVPGRRTRYRLRDESVRGTWLAALHDEERVSWQRRVARALPAGDGTLAQRVVAWAQALEVGDAERIRELGPRAARECFEVMAPDEALAVARATLESGAALPPPSAVGAELAIADAQALLGRWREALASYLTALRDLDDRSTRLAVARRMAELELADGAPEKAVRTLLAARGTLRLRVPRTELAARVEVWAERAIDALQRVNESRGLTSVASPRRERSIEVLRWLESYARAIEPLSPRRSTGSRLRALHLAARLGTIEAFPRLLERESREWLRRGSREWAVRLARRALSEREGAGTLSTAAPAHQALGETLLAAGRIEEALSHLEEAARGFEEQGDAWSTAGALEELGRAFAVRGEWFRAVDSWERLQRLARRLGDDARVARVLALLCLGYARTGDERHALELLGLEPRPDLPVAVRAERDLWIAEAKLALGQADEADQHLDRAAEWLASDRQAAPWLGAVLVATRAEVSIARLARAGAAAAGVDAGRLEARSASAMKLARNWPCLEARALRIGAQARRARGFQERRAWRLWWRLVERSLEAARRVGARWEEATTLLEAAAGLEARGDSRGRAYRVRAERLLAQGIPSVVPLVTAPADEPARGALADSGRVRDPMRLATPVPVRLPEVLSEKRRWKSLLELNQAISSILDTGELMERVVDLGLEVTGAQRGFLILAEAEPDLDSNLGTVPEGVAAHRFAGAFLNLKVARHAARDDGRLRLFGGSRSIVEAVLRDGASVLRADARRDPEFGKKGSVASQQIRSVLAVPLVRGGTAHGVLYVDNPLVAGLIHDRERELLEVFATQAAITLDNARAYSAIATLERRLAGENVRLKEHLRAEARPREIVGSSRALLAALEQVSRVAATESTVLLTGETGVGKELFARAIHEGSRRREGPFVKIDCAALPATLLESELFGHERGAFTGAERRRIGKFELGQGGTVFLDEIGNVPLELQVKLLQVLQGRSISRLGGRGPIEIDVRLVGATNRDLEEAVREGSFREDLFYRLNVVPIRVPSLRERREDIPLLVSHFVSRMNRSLGRNVHVVPEAVLAQLASYRWPGNVRELEHLIERSLVLAEGEELRLAGFQPPPSVSATQSSAAISADPASLADGLKRFKIARVRAALDQSRGNRAEAARILGLHRQNLSRLLRQLGLEEEAGPDVSTDAAD